MFGCSGASTLGGLCLVPQNTYTKISNTAARSHNENRQPWHQTMMCICQLSSDQRTSSSIPGAQKGDHNHWPSVVEVIAIALGTLSSPRPPSCAVKSEDHGLFRRPSLHSLDTRHASSGRCFGQDCENIVL